jgi:uncharacterized protein YkwD
MVHSSLLTGVCISAVLLFSCSTYTPGRTTSYPQPSEQPSGPVVTTAPSGSMEASILANINAHRRSLGLSSLQMIDAANQQAYNHSMNMATGKTAFGHDGFSQRVNNIIAVIGRVSSSAENVAYGSRTASEVVKGWLNSPPHKKNIEGNYNLTGIGVYANRQGTLYFTQLFVKQ